MSLYSAATKERDMVLLPFVSKSLYIATDDSIVEPSNGPYRLKSISYLVFKSGIVVTV